MPFYVRILQHKPNSGSSSIGLITSLFNIGLLLSLQTKLTSNSWKTLEAHVLRIFLRTIFIEKKNEQNKSIIPDWLGGIYDCKIDD